jgi:hypothetical protein
MTRIPLLLGVLFVLVACGGDDEPAPSPDELIAFSSNRGGDFDVYVMRPNGSGVRLVTRDQPQGRVEADDYEPAWSRDGRRIAFTSTRDHPGDGVTSNEIYVVGVDGGGLRRLTSNELSEFSPTWTSDGRIAFWRCRQATFACALVAVSPDGADEEVVYRARGSVFGADLTRQGDTLLLAVHDPRTTRPPSLYTVPLGSGEAREIAADAADAAWSPDADRIVFTSDRERDDDDDYELFVVAAGGGEPRRLTTTTRSTGCPTGSGHRARTAARARLALFQRVVVMEPSVYPFRTKSMAFPDRPRALIRSFRSGGDPPGSDRT